MPALVPYNFPTSIPSEPDTVIFRIVIISTFRRAEWSEITGLRGKVLVP